MLSNPFGTDVRSAIAIIAGAGPHERMFCRIDLSNSSFSISTEYAAPTLCEPVGNSFP